MTTTSIYSADASTETTSGGLLPLVAIVFTSFLCIGIPLPALPLHVNGVLGFSALTVGWVVGIQSFSTIFSRKFSGSYCDRHGPKRAVSIGLPMASVAGLLYLASTMIADAGTSLVVLFIGRLLMGPAESLFLTGTMTWGIGRVGMQRTGKVMAWQGIAMFAALGLGAPVGIATPPPLLPSAGKPRNIAAMARPTIGNNIVVSATPVKPKRCWMAMPTGAPSPRAANMAMPCHAITLPVRCMPTRPMPQVMVPVRNRLSAGPISKRPIKSTTRLVPASAIMVEARYSKPATEAIGKPIDTARLGP